MHDDRTCIVTVRDQKFLPRYVELDFNSIICRVDKFSRQCPWEYIYLYIGVDADVDTKTEISAAYNKSGATAQPSRHPPNK